jgi:hypothetical protein
MHKELEKLKKFLNIYLEEYPKMTWISDDNPDLIYFNSNNSLDEFIEIAMEQDNTGLSLGYNVDLYNETKRSIKILKKFSLESGKEAVVYAITEAVRLDLISKDISV